jgi:4-amino-4-deoxy-L-arabinose transferase-like glycosyltransferase
LLLLLWRQSRQNTLDVMLYGYTVLLFAFFYASRFLNENYIGYLAAFLALALALVVDEEGAVSGSGIPGRPRPAD